MDIKCHGRGARRPVRCMASILFRLQLAIAIRKERNVSVTRLWFNAIYSQVNAHANRMFKADNAINVKMDTGI